MKRIHSLSRVKPEQVNNQWCFEFSKTFNFLSERHVDQQMRTWLCAALRSTYITPILRGIGQET